MNHNPAPVLLFCYKRLNELKASVSALQQNELAPFTSLYIFSDGAKKSKDGSAVAAVRSYIRTITGFRSVTVCEEATNKGLARSIISGVTKVFEEHDRLIVLEDDLLTSTNFLSFMNQALEYYEEERKVFSIAGYSFPIKGLPLNSVYFTKRASSWGWAMWKDRWTDIDWEVKDYHLFRQNHEIRREFNRMGTDLAGMLDNQMRGKVDSWAIRWCYHQFKNQSYTVCPALSKVVNIGFGDEAAHTNESPNRYKTLLDQSVKTTFTFSSQIELDPKIIKQVTKHYSIRNRSYYKLRNLLSQKLRWLKS